EASHLLERESCQGAALGYFFEDAIVNQVEELGNYRESRDVPLAQGAEKLGGVQCRKKNCACTGNQRQQQVRHLRKDVKKRKHAKNGIVGADVGPREDRVCLGEQVGVSEHYSLRIGGCAR